MSILSGLKMVKKVFCLLMVFTLLIPILPNNAFAEEFGEDTIDWFDKAISQNIKDGLLEQEGAMLRLTPKGIDVSNFVFERFLE